MTRSTQRHVPGGWEQLNLIENGFQLDRTIKIYIPTESDCSKKFKIEQNCVYNDKYQISFITSQLH